MIKKIYSLMVVVIMATCILSVPVYANDVLTITAENKEIEIGTQTVSVKINISNNPGIATIGFNVGYDSDVMEIQEWTSTGAIFAEAEIDSNTSKNPFLISAYTGKTNKTADGEFLTLTFLIKPTCGEGTYPITLSRSNLGGALNIDEQDVEYELVSGSVTVKENQEKASAISAVRTGDASFSITLDGTDYNGSVIVAMYSSSNELMSLKIYKAEKALDISFNQTKNEGYVKIMWWKSINSMSPICESQKLSLR